jgi:carboxyl-terminal processing protease
MAGKILKAAALTLTVLIVAGGLFGGGFLLGHTTALPMFGGAAFTAPVGTGGTPAALSDKFAPFWEAWTLVHQEYVDQPVDDQKLAYGAIRGMLQALGDSHSGYDTPDEAKILQSDTSGQLEGIGAEVAAKGDAVEIISPMPGSPAEKAGVLPGDLVVGVNGENTTGQDLFTVINKIRGPAGTQVKLKILRAGEPDPLNLTITRARITIPSVESKLLKGSLAYVKINSFGETTAAELRTQLTDLMAKSPKGLILDLRGNPGGYRDAAIEVASQFIDQGPIMFQKYGDGRIETFPAKSGGLALKIPMVVLVNQGSASASEIVSGAIQDDKRGQIIGQQSYGKGTVQDWHPLSNDQGSVRITIARWLTPTKRSIDKLGITPDIPVALSKDDRSSNRDPQLDAAVKALSGG